MSGVIGRIAAWCRDPLTFVREVFSVDGEPCEPDAWQADVLRMIRPDGIHRIALKACTGPGKSTVLAWVGWWFLVTQARPGHHPRGYVISESADLLATTLWPEMSKWQERSPLLCRMFTKTATRIVHNEHPETWALTARSYPKAADPQTAGRALSGLHAEAVLYLIDESGAIPPSIGQAAEQGLRGSGVRFGLALQAGNPTSVDGLLYDSTMRQGSAWTAVSITADPDDPRRTPRIPVEQARADIARYGRDNPWIMSTILGEFPPGGFNALLSQADVETSRRRRYAAGSGPVVLGVDVARFGEDRTVILRRDGLLVHGADVHRGLDQMQVASLLMRAIDSHHPDAVFVDGTGGYGAGVIDRLRQLSYRVVEVNFAAAAVARERFANKRAEMWWDMAEWIKRTGQVLDDPGLERELVSATYGYQKGSSRLILEDKETMKKRCGSSPDLADALAVTFAEPVAAVAHQAARLSTIRDRPRYDPLGRVRGYTC